MFKKFIYLIVSCLALAPTVYSGDIQSQSRIETHVKYLSDDKLEGRFPGTQGIENAANYIEEFFKQNKIAPIGDSYSQKFKVTTGLLLGSGNKLEFSSIVPKFGIPDSMIKPIKRTMPVKAEWLPLGFSDNGTITGKLAFVGYGISSEKMKYDDYAGIDVKNKIVVMMLGAPKFAKEEEFGMAIQTRYKAKVARDNGAIGIIYINQSGDSADVLPPIKYEQTSRNSGIVAVMASRSALAKFFTRELSINFAEAEITKKKAPKSFDIINQTISLTVDLANDEKETRNMVGLIKGSDPALSNEYVVIGAHYDHLGYGQMGNSMYRGKSPMVHNGADDNASGVAGIMELGQRFAENPPKRSVVVIAFSSEELGLYGSAHYVENPKVPNDKVIMMMNFDMIGRLKDNKLQLFGSGSAEEFPGTIDSLATIDSITVVKLADGFGPSDHTSFYKKQIPVLHFFSGVHTDYHTPADDWNLLNFPGELKIVDFADQFIRHFADSPIKPTYKETKDTALKTAGPTKGSSGAWFGIIPNFEESPSGCKISGTSQGSPAQKAGLKENDVIVSINGKPVKNLQELMYTINDHKPGEVLNVVLLRDGKEMKVDVTLSVRK